jgi:hypothetical protein
VTFFYGTSEYWGCQAPFLLSVLFSKLNILSCYKYFSFACQLSTRYVILLCIVYSCHVTIIQSLGYFSYFKYYIIFHTTYNLINVVRGHVILWTHYKANSSWKPLSISWMMTTDCIIPSFCSCQALSYSYARPLYAFLLHYLRLIPLTRPLKLP